MSCIRRQNTRTNCGRNISSPRICSGPINCILRSRAKHGLPFFYILLRGPRAQATRIERERGAPICYSEIGARRGGLAGEKAHDPGRFSGRLPAQDRRHATFSASRATSRSSCFSRWAGKHGPANPDLVARARRRFRGRRLCARHRQNRRHLRDLRRRRPQHGQSGRGIVFRARAAADFLRRSRRGGAQARHADSSSGARDRVAASHLPGSHLRLARC